MGGKKGRDPKASEKSSPVSAGTEAALAKAKAEALQEKTAAEYVQDDKRERRLRDLFGLVKPEGSGRMGTDAELPLPPPEGRRVEFELKSATRSKITTARDLGPPHLKKWSGKHWLIGFFDAGGATLKECYYASPAQMKPWLEKTELYIKLDRELVELAGALDRVLFKPLLVSYFGDKEVYTFQEAKAIQKSQYRNKQYEDMMDRENGYSQARMLEFLSKRWQYITARGSTLNNPTIGLRFLRKHFKKLPIDPQEDARKALREAVKEALDNATE